MTTRERRLLALVAAQAVAIVALVVALTSTKPDLGRSPPPAPAPRGSSERAGEAGAPRRGLTDRERRVVGSASPASTGSSSENPALTASGPPRLLAGIVTDPSGLSLPKVTLEVEGAPGDLRLSADTDREGRYALNGLPPGQWPVRATKSGFRPLTEIVDVPGEALQSRRDFVLEPAVVLELRFRTPDDRRTNAALRRMKSDDHHHRDVIAVATWEKPAGHLPGSVRRDHSHFGCGQWLGLNPPGPGGGGNALRARGVDGLLQVNGDLPVWVSAVLDHRVLATQRVEPGQERVSFLISVDDVSKHRVAVRLRVVAVESGEPPPMARVSLRDTSVPGIGKPLGADGVVVFEGMRSGLRCLRIESPMLEQVCCYVLLEPRRTNDLGTFELAEATTISGIVVDPEGAPCRATVRWVSLDRTAALPQSLDMRWASTTADSEGRFTIWRLGRGRYLLTATQEGCALCTAVVPTWRGAVEGVRMDLQRAPVSVLDVRVPAGRVWLLRLLDENGVPRWARNALSARPIPLRLPPGSYSLEVYDEGELIRSLPLAVKGEAVEVVVEP